MARDARIEERLQRWAQAVTVGDGSGYPVMCTVHPDWTPPSPGITPTMKVGHSSDVGQTQRAIARLSLRMRNTVVVHYVVKPPIAEQARLLDCTVGTVYQRIDAVHAALQFELGMGAAEGSYCKSEERR